MKAAIGLVLLVACLVLAVNAETFPNKTGTLMTYAPDGYPLTKCGQITTSAQYDSVVAPLNWRIAKLDCTITEAGKAETFYLAIKQVYHGTHLDSFPTDPSASRVATAKTSGTSVAIMPNANTSTKQTYEYWPNTDKVYIHAASVSSTYELSWCAYLVGVRSEDRASDSTVAIEGGDEQTIPQFLTR